MTSIRRTIPRWILTAFGAGIGFLLLSEPLLAQQPVSGTFTTIDFPGSTYTRPLGINAEGDVAGNYRDTKGKSHGFVMNGAGFTSFDYPGALFTTATGINARGTIVGDYCPTGPCAPPDPNTYYGFVRSPDGEFTSSFVFPGHKNVFTAHINETGEITGCYHDDDLMGSMHGFLLSDGVFTGFDVPVSMHNAKSLDGTIVGLFYDPNPTRGIPRYRGYTKKDDTVSPFDFPGATATEGWDINEKGEIVGDYTDAHGIYHGFLWNKEGFFSIDYPGSIATIRGSINSRGDIVGAYIDKNNHTHGYLLTRHP